MTNEQIELAARAICAADGVDPDSIGLGLGRVMPLGESYPLWKARIAQAEAVLGLLEDKNNAVEG